MSPTPRRKNRSGELVAVLVTLASGTALLATGSAWAAQSATGAAAPPATAPAAEAKLEIDAKSKEVLDRAATVSLGKFATNRNLKSLRTTGRMVMAAAGINAEMTMIIDADGRQAMTMNIPGIGAMRSGLTKSIGWSFSEMTGPMVMSEKEVEEARRQADLYAPLNWDKRATKIVYAGESEVELPDGTRRPTHKLTITTRGTGDTETRHYDREHGWELRSETLQNIPGAGEVPLTTTYLDYREVSGMTVPFRTLVAMGPQVQEIVIEKVEVNPEIDESAFEVPAEVKQVADR